MKTCYLTYRPSQFDLHLAYQNGKTVIHLPNYTRIYDQKPVFNDTSLELLTFNVDDANLHTINNGGVQELYVWAGDRGTRSTPQDLVKVTLVTAMVPEVAVNPIQLAQDVFAGLPDEVKLAAVISATDIGILREYFAATEEQVIRAKGLSEAKLLEYTKQTTQV